MEAFRKYFIDTIKSRYIQFSGRATRSEFWYFTLFSLIFTAILTYIDMTLGLEYIHETMITIPATGDIPASEYMSTESIGYLSTFYSLMVFLPTISLSFRRLHDIGKSGWWLFIVFVPIVGVFILIYFYLQDSQADNNYYGSIPTYDTQTNSTKKSSPRKSSKPRVTEETYNLKSSSNKTLKVLGSVILFLVISVTLALTFAKDSVDELTQNVNQLIQETTSQIMGEEVNAKSDNPLPIQSPAKQENKMTVEKKSNEEQVSNTITPTEPELEQLEKKLKLLKEQKRQLMENL